MQYIKPEIEVIEFKTKDSVATDLITSNTDWEITPENSNGQEYNYFKD